MCLFMNACDRWVVCGPGEWAGGRMYELGVFFTARVFVCVCVMCRKLRVHAPAGRLLSVLLLVT